jgi:hypothetical protein
VRWLSRLASAHYAREKNSGSASALNLFSPTRLIIACAVTLSIIVVTSASLIVYNLRNRAVSENEQALSNSALIVAKQIEQTFTAVQAVQDSFQNDLAGLPAVSREIITNEYRRYDVHIKLRDKAGGMPYLGSLAIFNANGQLINFSRQWPIPDINIADEDYFKALKNGPAATSELGGPVRDYATGIWVIYLGSAGTALPAELLPRHQPQSEQQLRIIPRRRNAARALSRHRFRYRPAVSECAGAEAHDNF